MISEYIKKEYDAIALLLEGADQKYEQVLSVLEKCRGRLVFMGVGKSGHIGKKLAATFASLGILASFVHSTEAMHGDLGMISKDDIAILISNSGNTAEVVQNVAALKNNEVTTIAYTANSDGLLYKNCDYAIVYPKLNEADDNNLAPTVSSTLTLVLGDAIACELSKRRGFSKKDFFTFHPNGALGDMLKKELK